MTHHNVLVIEVVDDAFTHQGTLTDVNASRLQNEGHGRHQVRRFVFKVDDKGEENIHDWHLSLSKLKPEHLTEDTKLKPKPNLKSEESNLTSVRAENVTEHPVQDAPQIDQAVSDGSNLERIIEGQDDSLNPPTFERQDSWFGVFGQAVKELIDPTSPDALADVWCSWCEGCTGRLPMQW